MTLKLITPPSAEPLTRQEVKLHRRLIADLQDLSDHPDDIYIDTLIVAARQAAEHITGRALMLQSWERSLNGFREPLVEARFRDPAILTLQKAPLAALTSIEYVDPAGQLQTLPSSAYLLDDHSEPARLLPAYGSAWPVTRDQANAVRIRFTAGYANAAAVPQEIKAWMLLKIGTLYEFRESAAEKQAHPLGFVDCLLDPYRVWSA